MSDYPRTVVSAPIQIGQAQSEYVKALDTIYQQDKHISALTAQRDRLAVLCQRLVDDAETDGPWSDEFDRTFRKIIAALAELEKT